MLSKTILGGFLLFLAVSCFAGTAEKLAEEQALAYGKHLPMAFGESFKLVAVRSHGSKITYDLKNIQSRGPRSKSESAVLAKNIRDTQCADLSTRNYLAQGVSYEMKLIWKDNVTSLIAVDAAICGVKKGEINAASGADVKDMVDSLSPNLPVKIDEITTWVSISQVGRMGVKYIYVLDDSKHKIDTSQLDKMKLQVERTVCNNKNTSLMMRGGVEFIYLYKSISGETLIRTTITSASCKG